MGYNRDVWSDEHTKIVIENWGKLSASQIARLCPGHSRNAVIGKAHRLGLPYKVTNPRAPREPRRVRVPHYGRYGHPRLTHSHGILPPNSGNEAVELSIEPTLLAVGKTFMELGEHECRWPMQNFFCGAPTEGRTSYCLYHLLGALDVQRRKSKASSAAGEAGQASRGATS